MSCFISEKEMAFEKALSDFVFESKSEPKTLGTNTYTLFNNRMNAMWKGRDFLSSINQLKGLVGPNSHAFYDDFIASATKTLQAPTPINHEKLKNYLNQLSTKLTDQNYFSSWDIGLKISTHSLGLLIGAACGFNLILIALSATVGAAAAANPVVFAVLATAVMLIGIVLMMYEIYKLYHDIRYVKGSQFKEITNFVNHLTPYASVSNEEAYDANSDQQQTGDLAGQTL